MFSDFSEKVLITFDDGWLDNYTNAYPILKKCGLPAVIFLPVDFISTGKNFWQERMSAILFAVCEDAGAESLRQLARIGLESLVTLSPEKAKKTIKEYISRLNRSPIEERDAVISSLLAYARSLSFAGNSTDAFLSWEQVREMILGGVSFGSHSFRHEILTELTSEDVIEEVNMSKVMIEEKIRKPPA